MAEEAEEFEDEGSVSCEEDNGARLGEEYVDVVVVVVVVVEVVLDVGSESTLCSGERATSWEIGDNGVGALVGVASEGVEDSGEVIEGDEELEESKELVERDRLIGPSVVVVVNDLGDGATGKSSGISNKGDTSKATMSLKSAPDAHPPKITILVRVKDIQYNTENK